VGLDGDAVETEIVVPDQRRAHERIVEPPDPKRKSPVLRTHPLAHRPRRFFPGRFDFLFDPRLWAEVVTEEGAVEPDRILAEISTLALVGKTHRLVCGDGRVVFASGNANARSDVVAHVHLGPKAHADAETVAVFVDVELGRKLISGDIEGRAGVDRVEIGKGAGGVVAFRKEVAFITKTEIQKRTPPGNPGGDGDVRPEGKPTLP